MYPTTQIAENHTLITRSLFFLLGESIFAASLFYWLMVMLPNTRRKSKYKAMTHGSDSVPERIILFYQDHLSVRTDTGNETVYSYQDLSGWQETRHLYILPCKEHRYILIDKEGFVSGDFDLIKSLLNAK